MTQSSQEQKTDGLSFTHAFLASISMIIVSEIGDKTFFIAAIMAMKHSRYSVAFTLMYRTILLLSNHKTWVYVCFLKSLSRLLIFSGALSALGLMTFLSVCLGYATLIIPRSVTFYLCTALLALFGFKMLYEGYKMSPDEGQEELEEVSEELKKREEIVS